MLETKPRLIITETWLSQKPDPQGFMTAAFMTMLLAVASLIYWNNWGQAFQWMAVSQNGIYQDHFIWQAFTALFAHADEKHLLSNSFLFFILGGFLASYFGAVLFPTLAFLSGALINSVVILGMDPESKLLGASGIVFWMGGAWLALYFLLDLRHSYYQRALRATGVALLLFFPAQAFEPQISYMSHFLGFFLGALTGVIFYFLNRQKFLSFVKYRMVFDEEISEAVTEPAP